MKKKTKPTSVILDEELSEELGQRCNELGCSKSDFIKNSVEYTLTGSSEFDFDGDDEENSTVQGTKDTKPKPETIIGDQSGIKLDTNTENKLVDICNDEECTASEAITKLINNRPSEMTNVTVESTNARVVQEPTEPEKPPEIKIKKVIENFKHNYECPDGNCDVGIHRNEEYSRSVKGKCDNCDQFTKNKDGTCPWCKGTDIEEVDPEYLVDLGIRLPEREILN